MRQPSRPTTKMTYVLLACQAPLPHAEPVAAVAGPFVVVARVSLSVSVPPWSCPRPAGGNAGPIPAPHAARGRQGPAPGRPEGSTPPTPAGPPGPAPGRWRHGTRPRGSTGARAPHREEAPGAGAGRIAAPSLVSSAILGVKRRRSRRPTRRRRSPSRGLRGRSRGGDAPRLGDLGIATPPPDGGDREEAARRVLREGATPGRALAAPPRGRRGTGRSIRPGPADAPRRPTEAHVASCKA
jgi:hypothetical protein